MAREAMKSRRICGLQLNSLWSVWCFVLVLAVQIYLTYAGIVRYQHYNSLPWKPNKRPTTELNSCLALLVLSLLCLPAFAMSALFKIGNYSNDGVKLGRDWLKESHHIGWRGTIKRLYKHIGPVAQTLHILSAFLMLLPTVLLEARAIMVSSENLWGTDLDVVFGSETEKVYQILNTTHLPSITEHLKLPSVEFINYVAAILVYCVRYAAVFWFTHRAFTVLFSTQLCMTLFMYVISFCGFNILYKVLKNGDLVEPSFILSSGSLLVLFILSIGFIFTSSTTVFRYGYYFYNEQLKVCRNVTYRAEECHAYIHHIIAMVTLLLAAICKAPIIYDYVVIYRSIKHNVVLAAIIFDAVYLLFWIVLWLALTLRQSWTFRVLNPHDNYGIELHERETDVSTTATMSKHSLDDLSPATQTTNGDIKMEIVHENHELSQPSLVVTMVASNLDRNDTPHSETSSVVTTDSQMQNHPITGVLKEKVRAKRRSNSIQHRSVTFRDKVDTLSPRASSYRQPKQSGDIVVDVHENMSATNTDNDADGESTPDQPDAGSSAILRPNHLNLDVNEPSPENTLKKNYRYSLRESNKYYHSQQSLSPRSSTASPPPEPTQIFYQPHVNKGFHGNGQSSAISSDTKQTILNGQAVSYQPQGAKPISVKKQMGRRDSANFSLTSSQETSSNDSDTGGLCSQV